MNPVIERYPGRDEWKVYRDDFDRAEEKSVDPIRKIAYQQYGWNGKDGLKVFPTIEAAAKERIRTAKK
jgi:hypothetical protein